MVAGLLRHVPKLAFVGPLIVYLALPAATINGDGLRYWKLATESTWAARFIPGHLIYVALQTLVVDGGARFLPQVSAVSWMRLVSQLSAAGAVCVLSLTTRRLGLKASGQALAVLGFACSYGVWVQAIDVETYAVALLWVTASIAAMAAYAQRSTVPTAMMLGLFNSLAALFHLATATLIATSLLLIVLVNLADRRRSVRHAAVFLAATLLCLVVPVAVIAFGVLRIESVGALVAWLQSSDHGYQPGFGLASFPRAAYGFVRNLLYLEFFWTTSRWHVAFKFTAFLLIAAWFLQRVRRSPATLSTPMRAVLSSLLPFVAFQVLLGVCYFGSDTERWVFLTPWLWLLVASLSSGWPTRSQAVVLVSVVVMGAVNCRQGIWPVATDYSTEKRLNALSPLLTERSLIISPGGDDWLSWYDFYNPPGTRPEFLKLTELAAQFEHRPEGLFESLTQTISQALRDGRLVLLIRVRDEDESNNTAPWQYLSSLGYPRENFRAWFEHYRWAVLHLPEPGRTRVDRLLGYQMK